MKIIKISPETEYIREFTLIEFNDKLYRRVVNGGQSFWENVKNEHIDGIIFVSGLTPLNSKELEQMYQRIRKLERIVK